MTVPTASPLIRPSLLSLALLAALAGHAPLVLAETDPGDATTLDTVKVTADGDIPTSYTVKQARTATKLDLSLRHTRSRSPCSPASAWTTWACSPCPT